MKLIFLFGDGAVGKMTVGQELMKITDLRLFHNHMTIEPVLEIFNDFNVNAILRMREVIFEEFAKSDNYGMIFTFMWAFDCEEDWKIHDNILSIFDNYDTEYYYVELTAPLEVRLARNSTENRLANKASKRDIEASNARLISMDQAHRFESFEGELKFDNYIKIDNTDKTPTEVAKLIKETFDL